MIQFRWVDESKKIVRTEVSDELYDAIERAAKDHHTTFEQAAAVFLDAAVAEYFKKPKDERIRIESNTPGENELFGMNKKVEIPFNSFSGGISETDLMETDTLPTITRAVIQGVDQGVNGLKKKRGRSARKFCLESQTELDQKLDKVKYGVCPARNCISGGKYVKGTEFWEPISPPVHRGE